MTDSPSSNPSPTPRHTRSIKSAVIAAMVVVNAALGLSLVSSLTEGNTAEAAQVGRPSEYLMIPAQITNLNSDIVYIIDTQTGNLTAAAMDQTSKTIQFIAPVPLGDAFNQQRGGRR